MKTLNQLPAGVKRRERLQPIPNLVLHPKTKEPLALPMDLATAWGVTPASLTLGKQGGKIRTYGRFLFVSDAEEYLSTVRPQGRMPRLAVAAVALVACLLIPACSSDQTTIQGGTGAWVDQINATKAELARP